MSRVCLVYSLKETAKKNKCRLFYFNQIKGNCSSEQRDSLCLSDNTKELLQSCLLSPLTGCWICFCCYSQNACYQPSRNSKEGHFHRLGAVTDARWLMNLQSTCNQATSGREKSQIQTDRSHSAGKWQEKAGFETDPLQGPVTQQRRVFSVAATAQGTRLWGFSVPVLSRDWKLPWSSSLQE